MVHWTFPSIYCTFIHSLACFLVNIGERCKVTHSVMFQRYNAHARRNIVQLVTSLTCQGDQQRVYMEYQEQLWGSSIEQGIWTTLWDFSPLKTGTGAKQPNHSVVHSWNRQNPFSLPFHWQQSGTCSGWRWCHVKLWTRPLQHVAFVLPQPDTRSLGLRDP